MEDTTAGVVAVIVGEDTEDDDETGLLIIAVGDTFADDGARISGIKGSGNNVSGIKLPAGTDDDDDGADTEGEDSDIGVVEFNAADGGDDVLLQLDGTLADNNSSESLPSAIPPTTVIKNIYLFINQV